MYVLNWRASPTAEWTNQGRRTKHRAPITLSKESEQRLGSTDRGNMWKAQAPRALKPVKLHRYDRIPTSSRWREQMRAEVGPSNLGIQGPASKREIKSLSGRMQRTAKEKLLFAKEKLRKVGVGGTRFFKFSPKKETLTTQSPEVLLMEWTYSLCLKQTEEAKNWQNNYSSMTFISLYEKKKRNRVLLRVLHPRESECCDSVERPAR